MVKRVRAVRTITALSWAADPLATVVSLALGAAATAMQPLTALLTGQTIDAIVRRDWSTVVFAAVGIGALQLGGDTAGVFNFRIRARLREKTTHVLDMRLMATVGGIVDLEHLERPDYADRIEILRSERNQLSRVLEILMYASWLTIQILIAVLILARTSPWLCLLAAFGVPSVVAGNWAGRMQQSVAEDTAEPMRLAGKLHQILTTAEGAGEVRVFGLAPGLLRQHDELWSAAHDRRTSAAARGQAVLSSAWLVFAVGYVGAVFFTVSRALRGAATAGDVAITLLLAAQLRDYTTNSVSIVIGLLKGLNAVEHYLWLVDFATDKSARATAVVAEPPPRLAHGISFDRVGFTYPGTDREVLSDVSLFVPAGATVAVIGDNGAGKSTLVKLLARCYEPTRGQILIDGVPLVGIDADEWRSRISAGFQDFLRPEFVAREVVGLGDLARIDDDARIRRALRRAGADNVIDTLPAGLETQLGRAFDDGVELSGGQWQKLALGRASMRDPLVLLLDEPTASLDPVAERALFDVFADAAHKAANTANGITVLVSHRFSTVRMATQIVVVQNGTIVESGSHDELMRRAGVYRSLYSLQASAYE